MEERITIETFGGDDIYSSGSAYLRHRKQGLDISIFFLKENPTITYTIDIYVEPCHATFYISLAHNRIAA